MFRIVDGSPSYISYTHTLPQFNYSMNLGTRDTGGLSQGWDTERSRVKGNKWDREDTSLEKGGVQNVVRIMMSRTVKCQIQSAAIVEEATRLHLKSAVTLLKLSRFKMLKRSTESPTQKPLKKWKGHAALAILPRHL